MRSARVDYSPAASQELEDALDWYLERSIQAAEAFETEVERAVGLIASSPKVWPFFAPGARRYVLQGFPYSLIYREREAVVEVIALAHHKRRPYYWRARV